MTESATPTETKPEMPDEAYLFKAQDGMYLEQRWAYTDRGAEHLIENHGALDSPVRYLSASIAIRKDDPGLARVREMLADINANSSDAGSSHGKVGEAWIAASCREISEVALRELDKLMMGVGP